MPNFLFRDLVPTCVRPYEPGQRYATAAPLALHTEAAATTTAVTPTTATTTARAADTASTPVLGQS